MCQCSRRSQVKRSTTDMEKLCNSCQMTAEVAFGPLRYSFAAPCHKSVLWKASVRVFHLDVPELCATIRELVNKIDQFSLCDAVRRVSSRAGLGTYLPPVLWTLSTLSLFPESCWKALTKGADIVKTAHCPYVGEPAAEPDGGGALTTDW